MATGGALGAVAIGGFATGVAGAAGACTAGACAVGAGIVAVCPLCVIGAPILIGYGIYKRKKHAQKARDAEKIP